MKTVDKALTLLSHFTVRASELGLSEIARLADIDKATALRLLSSLRRHGFVEQDARSKKYRLGNGLLRFARIREACFPTMRVMQPVLDKLAADTGETCHGSLASGPHLISVGSAEPDRTTRVFIDPSQPLPYHATATGLAFLAFAPPETVREVLAAALPAFTPETQTSREALSRALEATRSRGYAIAMRTFESDVVSIAAPIFDGTAWPIGSLSVACIASRWAPGREVDIARMVVAAAGEVTRGIGGEPSHAFAATSLALARQPVTEAAPL